MSDRNTLEEVATTVYLQKTDVSKLGKHSNSLVVIINSNSTRLSSNAEIGTELKINAVKQPSGREIQTVITDITSLKYELETLSSSFASYKQSNYGLADKINSNSVALETLTQKLYYQDTALQSVKQQVILHQFVIDINWKGIVCSYG